MSKLTREEKVRRYHAIYDQIYSNPRIHVHEVSKNLKVARNTVSSYLDEMYESGILFGPELRLKYYSGLNIYMYLVKFDDPYAAFDQLQRDPRVTFASMYFGDWNIMLISDADYEISRVSGFENLLYKGRRYDIITPRTQLREWKTSFQKMRQEMSELNPESAEDPDFMARSPPDWDEEEWTLFYEYQHDFRKKVTPVLRKHLVSSDKFYRWMATLSDSTNVIMRFYADGVGSYTHFGFFFRTKYAETVISLLSNLPTTISSIHVEGGLVTTLSIKSDIASTFLSLFTTIHKMRTSGIVEKFNQAIGTISYDEVEEED
jgi:DNA-binding Lrp family transcriptional regulator